MDPLTERQQKVLEFVDDYVRRNGFPPTFREIGNVLGLANVNAVRGHVAALEKKGYITKDPDKARSIRVVHSPSPLSRFKRKLHEVLGTDEEVIHRVVYGLAWTTWQRTPYFTGGQRQGLEEGFGREAVEHGWRIIEARIEPDHVVVVVEVWPNHSPEQTVGRLRSAGRSYARHHAADFPGRHLWAKGYVATTDLALLDELVARLLTKGAEPKG